MDNDIPDLPTEQTPEPKSAPRAEPREPRTPKKANKTLAALAVALVLIVIAGIFWSNHISTSLIDPSTKFSSSLQKLEGGGLTVEFKTSRDLPAGIGLQNLLDSVPGHERVVGVHAEGTATYQVDNRGDWDLTNRDGRTVLTVPAPELKSVLMNHDSISFKMNGAELTAEDADLARQILEEKLPDLLRQDEEGRRAERLAEIRDRVKKFALDSLHNVPADQLDVVFPGDGAANEPGEDVE